MPETTIADAWWSIRRFIEANIRPIAPVYYAPPQEQAESLYVIFRTMYSGSLDMQMEPVVRLSAVGRGGEAGMAAAGLASQVATVFDNGHQKAKFDLYQKDAGIVVGSCLVRRVDIETLVHFEDGTDVVPVDVSFRFRSTYAPRV